MTINIKASSLVKSYRHHTVVDNISFEAIQGDVVGFLGPNGAGKTTTMRMLAGFLLPDSGAVEICGVDAFESHLKAKSRVGYLPEGAPLYDEMRVIDFLYFVAKIRNANPSELNENLETVISRIHLEQVLYQRIESLSKGFKRRVGFAQAVIHNPDILIMDEPTDGLDPSQKIEVRELIREMAADKVIILSTHNLEEVEAVCNRVMVIAGGKLLADQTVTEMTLHKQISLETAFLSLTQSAQDRT